MQAVAAEEGRRSRVGAVGGQVAGAVEAGVRLPPVPGGRTWVVAKAVQALAAVLLAALEQGSQEHLGELTVPSEIVHRGRFDRIRTLSGGLFAVAVPVVEEQAGQSLIATARQHAVPVTAAEPLATPGQAARVASVRDRTAADSQWLSGSQEAAAGPEPGDLPEPPPAAELPSGSPADPVTKAPGTPAVIADDAPGGPRP